VVNNKSTDNTVQVFEDFEKNNPNIKIRLVHENRQGLSHARIKGFKESSYEILVYCDDDNLLDCNFLQTAFDFMMANPEVGQCGGLGEAIFEAEPDPRILTFLDIYATGPQGQTPICDITDRGYANGAGMVTRQSILKNIFEAGFQFLSTDRHGSKLASGGDVELGYAIIAAGYRIFYNKNMKFKHILARHRLSWNYLRKMVFGSGNSNVFFHPDSVKTFRNNPFYIYLHYCFRTLKRLPNYIMGFSKPMDIIQFIFFCGAVLAVHREFWNLFSYRAKVISMYHKISSRSDDLKKM
jgi:glycosyltransferase involved in cell wall biosynthesis